MTKKFIILLAVLLILETVLLTVFIIKSSPSTILTPTDNSNLTTTDNIQLIRNIYKLAEDIHYAQTSMEYRDKYTVSIDNVQNKETFRGSIAWDNSNDTITANYLFDNIYIEPCDRRFTWNKYGTQINTGNTCEIPQAIIDSNYFKEGQLKIQDVTPSLFLAAAGFSKNKITHFSINITDGITVYVFKVEARPESEAENLPYDTLAPGEYHYAFDVNRYPVSIQVAEFNQTTNITIVYEDLN